MKEKYFIPILFLNIWGWFFGSLQAQGYLKKINPADYRNNFLEMSKQIDMYYDTASGSNRSGYKQWKRTEWFAMQHLDEKGDLSDYVTKNIEAEENLKQHETSSSRTSASGQWMNLGHSIPSAEARQGRVNSVAFDPVNSAIVYAATTGGGIWKTYNNGDNWANLTIDLPILSIADIAVTPAPNNNIIYALTGDLVGQGTNVYIHEGIGVLKSNNSGATWTRTNFNLLPGNNERGYKILISPTNPNQLLVATRVRIYLSMDGGNTWTNTAASGDINDIEFKPNNPDTLYLVKRNDNKFYKLCISTNLVVSRQVTSLTVDRMEIGVTPDNPAVVYVLAGPGFKLPNDPTNYFRGLFKYNNNSGPFTFVTGTCVNNGDLFNSGRNAAWYDNTILVDPNEENNVLAGGLYLFRSIDGGINLFQITANSIHSDEHNLKQNPLNGDIWLCSDGGVYRSIDNGISWTNKSTDLVITEYYRLSGTKDIKDLILGGAQDNGHILRNTNGNFQIVMGFDGMDNYFNSLHDTIAYACAQNGDLFRSVDQGLSFNRVNFLPNVGNPNFYPWITPILQHPPFYNQQSGMYDNPDVIYVYSLNGIMRCTNGLTWDNMGPFGIGSVNLCASMAICQDFTGTTLYVSNGDNFWRCEDPINGFNGTWVNRPLPTTGTNSVSAIAVNPANRNEVWAVISGYSAGNKVFRTQNGGDTWSNLSLGLPNVPVYSIAFANIISSPGGAVYIGTEIGVFYTDDNLPDWVPFYNDLPHVPVTDLEVNYFLAKIKTSTYGRGIWESDTYEACSDYVGIYFPIDQGHYNIESSDSIVANSTINGGIGTDVRIKAANRVRLINDFHIYPDSYMHIKIGNCGTGPINLQFPQVKPLPESEGLSSSPFEEDEDEDD